MPDIEWQVQDEAGEQTLIKTAKRSNRWRLGLIALMIVLGGSLGVIYGRVQEPAPRPTPTPTLRPTLVPTLAPLPLIQTIDQESLALARGDRSAFMAVQDLSNGKWYQTQQKNFEGWGIPAGGSKPYLVMDSGTLPNGSAYAEVYQYRTDRYFRETRFYRVVGGVWLRAEPALTFWSSPRELDSAYFHVTFSEEDGELSRDVLFRFEAAYEKLCRDLNCPPRQFPRALNLTLSLSPLSAQPRWQTERGAVTIVLPSPRLMGVYDYRRSADDPISRAAYNSLITPITQLASGNYDRWQRDLSGRWYLEAIAAWELYRLQTIEGEIQPDLAQAFYSDLLSDVILIPLETTWTWHVDQDPGLGAGNDRGQIEAEAVITYIDQTYGADRVVQFLNTLGNAPSIDAALQSSLQVKFTDFNRAWLKWLGR